MLAKYQGEVFAYEFYKCVVWEKSSLERFWLNFELNDLHTEKAKLLEYNKVTHF